MLMTSAELLLKYAKEHGWYSVANIFHDNEYSHQPHSSNGLICASPSLEMIFTVGKVDYENTPIIETNYAVAPYNHIDFEQTVVVLTFACLQRWDALTFTQGHHYPITGPIDEFPIPTLPSPAEIEAIELDPETGLAPGYPIAVLNNRRYSDKKRNEEDPLYSSEVSVLDVHPNHPEWSNDKFIGLRIKAIQDFIKNQKHFCQQCNTMFGVSDCE